MLNNNRKFDYGSFCYSRFHNYSSRLSFLDFAGTMADIIVLVATTAAVCNWVTSHTEMPMPSVECGKWKLGGNMPGTLWIFRLTEDYTYVYQIFSIFFV